MTFRLQLLQILGYIKNFPLFFQVQAQLSTSILLTTMASTVLKELLARNRYELEKRTMLTKILTIGVASLFRITLHHPTSR